jgi:hypothetical protein
MYTGKINQKARIKKSQVLRESENFGNGGYDE